MQGSSSSIIVHTKSTVTARDISKSQAYVRALKKSTESPELGNSVDYANITSYFMGFWRAPQAALALTALDRYESKRMLKALRKKYGQWCPPAEVTQALQKPRPSLRSHLPDTKDCRNLQFVLKMLGCSIHENRPYKQFLKARSVRQKRLWMYKYMHSQSDENQTQNYSEPICPTRLKRLYHFFPDRFSEENNEIYFNCKAITYNQKKDVFYFDTSPNDDNES